MAARFWSPDELRPLPDEGLACTILRMCFARDDELYRALRIAQQTQQSLRIVQQHVGTVSYTHLTLPTNREV